MKKLRQIYIVILSLLEVSKCEIVNDYFTNKTQFRPCAKLNLNHEQLQRVLTEVLPAGFTFFSNLPEQTSTYQLDSTEEGCQVKFCQDGIFSQISCYNVEPGYVIKPHGNSSLICNCSILDVPQLLQENEFSDTFFGVVFSPYVNDWIRSNESDTRHMVAKWNSYSISDIRLMLSVLATKFTHFSTYGTGGIASRTWDDGDATGKVPVAAAQLNQILAAIGHKTLTIYQGIYQNEYDDIMNQEIKNALAASQAANLIYPGTVTGLIFTSDYVTNNITGSRTYGLIDKYRAQVNDLGLQIGIRLKSCTNIIPTKLSESDNSLHSVPSNYTYEEFKTPATEMELVFEGLMSRVDFIICSNEPPPYLTQRPMAELVTEYGNLMLRIRSTLRSVKPNITVIAQGQWASWGVSQNGASNTVSNLVEFWNRINYWAVKNNFRVDMFESFDEPWKSDLNAENNFGPNGPGGAEGNYGWWERHDSSSLYTYIPKTQEIDLQSKMDLNNSPKLDPLLVSFLIIIIIVIGVTIYLLCRLWKANKKQKTQQYSREAKELVKDFRYGTLVAPAESKDLELEEKVDDNKHGTFVCALRFPYDKKYELLKKNFCIDESCVLGKGNYGIVYKGKIDGINGDVAFKTLNSNGSIIELKNLLSEIKIIAYVGSHPHIVNLLGAYTAKIEQGEVYVASEYCSLGNLQNYLRAQRGQFVEKATLPSVQVPTSGYVVAYFEEESDPSPVIIPQMALTMADLLKWAYEIANGMEHISGRKVIHSDLATRNVLLTADKTAKIADFGLSRQLYYKSEYLKSNTKEELPWRWMSLESLRSLVFSIESDVWSYGITLWEIFSLAETPYPGIPGWTSSFLNELEQNYRMDSPKYSSSQVFDLMTKCWLATPSERSSFTQLKEEFYNEWQDELKT